MVASKGASLWRKDMTDAFRIRVIAILFVLVPGVAGAEIFKCVDPRTKATAYSDSPCAAGVPQTVSIPDKFPAPQPPVSGGANAAGKRPSAEANRSPQVESPIVSAGPDFAVQKERLANECARGMQKSCSALRTLSATSSSGPKFSDQKERLANECARGFQGSCKALRNLARSN